MLDQALSAMSEEANTDVSYLSCDINGTKYIYKLAPSPTDIMKDPSEEQNAIDIAKEGSELDNGEEPISIVCLNGQLYAIKDGVIEEVDTNQAVERTSCDETSFLIAKDTESNETDYITNEDMVIERPTKYRQPEEQYEVATKEEAVKDFVAEDDSNVNFDDFLEVVTAFKCKMCTYLSQDKMQLLDHIQKLHLNSTVDVKPKDESKVDEVRIVYMCAECSNCFHSFEDCREHMINDHQLMDIGSDEAGKENLTDENLTNPGLVTEHEDQHIESGEAEKSPVKISKTLKLIQNLESELDSEYMHNRKMIESEERNGCPYKFASEEIMQQHVLCHTESETATTFKCSVCRDMKFPKWRQCSLHLWKKHQIDIDLFTCKICKVYKSATIVKLLTHMRVHSDSRDYKCPDCEKCFKQASQLRNHRIMHLDRKTLEATRWYTSKKCEICGKTYANSKCLKNHIQAVHSKLRPYVCNVCGHASARRAMLQMHLRQHTGDKPFSCEICDYKTGDHNTLRRHIMQHTGFRPYKCPHCSYTAIQSSSYKNHLKSKHPLLSGLFTCDLCPFKTVKNESYIQHLGDHEKGLIKSNVQKKDNENVEVFPGNIAAAQLVYSCLGAFSKDGDTLEANLMSSSTSADGTSQTITIQIPSKHLQGSLSTRESLNKNDSTIEQEDDETMHCFLKIPREEEESIDTGGITIPAEPEERSIRTIDIEETNITASDIEETNVTNIDIDS
ncbi:PREDICTED: PR domain zinc finger protein 5-like isoform X2 [Wasmannia auropunctata]|uniref:PR domain zinc finger protein 5-like isoform X2 n=1 Tax=Wasmannia auropunctata TaxID=64793 RepID=UPI0005EE6FF2|nr:PREDICTED: PR domain zinc finger protein 5-like isoform X2 [Wasmannia auropunctata]